jgi:hypothetical protein
MPQRDPVPLVTQRNHLVSLKTHLLPKPGTMDLSLNQRIINDERLGAIAGNLYPVHKGSVE